jgi:hypothetical protein
VFPEDLNNTAFAFRINVWLDDDSVGALIRIGAPSWTRSLTERSVRILPCFCKYFSELKDNREPWRVVYSLQDVLLLVCG